MKIEDPHAFLRAAMRTDFRIFLRKAFASIRGGALLKWNWHLDAIAYELGRIECGDNRRLLVMMPPRNLKSITISVAWVAWQLGRDPRRNFVCVSYSNDLSAKHARDCLALMESAWYRELFPKTVISRRRTAVSDFETTVGGGRLATSVTGTLTGRGGDIIIIDDPIKPDEAQSDAVREAANDWFKSTLGSRLDDKITGSVVVVMQRLHQFDMAGMLIEMGGWIQLSLPAIAFENQVIRTGARSVHRRAAGDVLHPSHESREALDDQLRLMGPLNFDAQYQQQPVPVGGNIIKAEWLRTYPCVFDPKTQAGQIIQSWDTASKDGAANDYSVCVTAHTDRGLVRVLDVFRAKLAFPDLKEEYVRLARQFQPSTILVEDAASGTQLIQSIRAEKPTGVVQAIARKPDADKMSRIFGVSGMVASGQLLLPAEAHWLTIFKTELLGFPAVRYDDQCDALTQLMLWVRQLEANTSNEVIEGPILYSEDLGWSDGYKEEEFDPDFDPWL